MKKIAIAVMALIGLAILVPGGPAMAQNRNTPVARIILVDFDRVSRESLVGKDIAAQMESHRVDLEKKARAIQQELKAEEEELKKQRNIISPEAFQQRVQALQRKAQAKQTEINGLGQQARRAMQQAQLEVQRVLRPIVKKIMDERGANMVMDKALVSQHAAGLDITTEVIERLDQAMPSFDVQLPKIRQEEAAAPAQ
ncbi:MAG: OmpH family outer membrane protein [Alphaproteobacteria bacterium]|nr:MAG: OmpH family outer membrane protein [Alphaproteobacteria bacterium]